MTECEAEIDLLSLDPRRYGPWVNREYAARKNEECYSHVYILHHPDEEREAARPLRTSPAYQRLKSMGAQFGQVNGWERANYFGPLDAPEGFDHDARSFRRGGWWRYAEAEARAVREGVGLFDATPFAKTRVRGPGAAQFLDWLTCNKLPKVGRINLTYALTEAGTVRTEATIVRLAEDDFYVVTAGAAQAYDFDFFEKEAARHRESMGWIEVQDVTSQWGVLAIAGPKSRDVLRELIVDADPATALSNKRFPWLSMRNIDLGMVPVRAIRVAYTGELGWELHHPMEMQAHLLDRLLEAGEGHGMKMFGARAQNWLRQEKSYRAFGSELGRDASPLESGLDRFVDLSKDFRGKAAMEALGVRAKCVTVKIHGPDDADPWGRESLLSGGECVGRLTSGGWSVAWGTQIGLGYVPPALSSPGTKLQCRIMGALWDAEVVEDSPYDPTNARIRSDG